MQVLTTKEREALDEQRKYQKRQDDIIQDAILASQSSSGEDKRFPTYKLKYKGVL